MDNTKGIMSFPRPAHYDAVIAYADTCRKNFAAIRDLRPVDAKEIEAALNGFLENSLFSNCTPNKAYIKALGFSVP